MMAPGTWPQATRSQSCMFACSSRASVASSMRRTLPRRRHTLRVVTANRLSPIRRFLGAMFSMPDYPPDERDLRTFRLAGLELPVRATVVVVAVILIVIFDFQRTLIPDELLRYDRNPGEQRLQALSRVFLFLVVPLAIVLFGFRDRPDRYGLRFGDWRWGLGLAVVGCVVMTPIIVVLG